MAQLTEAEAGGMTVNERLVVAGLMHDFDAAVAQRTSRQSGLFFSEFS